MNSIGSLSCIPGAAAARRVRVLLQRCFGWLLLALLLGACPAQADDSDDQYLQAYNLIQQADTLGASGKAAAATAKYQEARAALASFKTNFPDWNAKLVSYRLNYIAEKMAALTEKASAAATNAPETRTGAKAAGSVSATQVKLLEAGAEPRKGLRLHPNAGDKQTLNMTMNIVMETKMGEMATPAVKMPPIKMTLDATIKSVAENGDITYELVMGDTTVGEEPGAVAPMAEAIKAAVAGLKGASGTGTMSSRGESKGLEFKAPPGSDAQARQMMDQMKESFAHITAPLPEEAVGPGAKWEVKLPIKTQGMTIAQTTTYELVSLEGERLTTKSTVTQQAANQKIQNPAMPGMKVDLTKMTGTGTGESTVDLTKLLPIAGAIDFKSETVMAMNMGGQKQPMTIKMDMHVRFEAK